MSRTHPENAKTTAGLEELARQGCTDPSCVHDVRGELHVWCRAHRAAPLRVTYQVSVGVLRFYCSECRSRILEVAVAE